MKNLAKMDLPIVPSKLIKSDMLTSYRSIGQAHAFISKVKKPFSIGVAIGGDLDGGVIFDDGGGGEDDVSGGESVLEPEIGDEGGEEEIGDVKFGAAFADHRLDFSADGRVHGVILLSALDERQTNGGEKLVE